ncbi:hypothetical protein LINPERPRIM_LOCUS20831 [Linum perenne]
MRKRMDQLLKDFDCSSSFVFSTKNQVTYDYFHKSAEKFPSSSKAVRNFINKWCSVWLMTTCVDALEKIFDDEREVKAAKGTVHKQSRLWSVHFYGLNR